MATKQVFIRHKYEQYQQISLMLNYKQFWSSKNSESQKIKINNIYK